MAVEALARVIAARMDHVGWNSDPKRLAIFLVSDRPRELAVELNAKKEPILDNGSQSLAGKLWVSGPNFASGYYVALEANDHGALFEEVEAKGVGDRPALVFDPTATDPEIRFYPRGLSDSDHVQRFLVAEKTFTLSALDKVLNAFYEKNIIAPGGDGEFFNPWQDGTQYIPRERTEAYLQSLLKFVLRVALRGCWVQFEVAGTEGRCDLLVVSKHATKANSWVYHAALELKVLRSFSAAAKPISSTVRAQAIADGLLQAIAYKKQFEAKHGLLCCLKEC